jgi:hypothetical protein
MRRWGLVVAAVLVALASPAAAERLSPMSFRIISDGQGNRWIAAQGDIMENSADRYAALVRRGGRGLPVHIHSGGGSLLGGMTLGMAFRQAGARVVVARTVGNRSGAGICASACVHALAGGAERITPEGSRIGVHESYRASVSNGRITRRVSAANDDPAVRQQVLAIQSAYFRAMGVSADVVTYGIGVPPNRVRRLSDREIGATGLARTSGAASQPAPGRGNRAGIERYRPDY